MRTTLTQYVRHLLNKVPHAEAIGAACLLATLQADFFRRAALLGESLLPNDLVYELDPIWQSHPVSFVVGLAVSMAALACCVLWAAVILYQRMR